MTDIELEVPDFIDGLQARAWAEGILAQVRRDQQQIERLQVIVARLQLEAGDRKGDLFDHYGKCRHGR